jgi:hypothetical protein
MGNRDQVDVTQDDVDQARTKLGKDAGTETTEATEAKVTRTRKTKAKTPDQANAEPGTWAEADLPDS